MKRTIKTLVFLTFGGVLTGCVNNGEPQPFYLAAVPENPNCKVLARGDGPIIRIDEYKNKSIFGVGECPKGYPHIKGAGVWTMADISVNGERSAKVRTKVSEKTGNSYNITVWPYTGSYKYKWFKIPK